MKGVICVVAFLSLHAVSFAQLRINAPADDTLMHTPAIRSSYINTFGTTAGTVQNTQAIPLDFYARHLGFFCREELKMQQIHVPITFRVGSMDQCNYLEQKPGYKIN